MHPVLFTIGSFAVYSYGVMVALGFAVATFFVWRGAEQFGFDRNKVVDVMIIALVSGIIGARALYVMINLAYYRQNPLEALNLSRGGLVWYGGFIVSFLTLVIYTRRARWDLWKLLDLIAPYIALAQGFGRIGCFLNGCCYGVEAPRGNFFSVLYPGEHALRHPSQLYSAVLLFGLFAILKAWQDRRRFAGEIFLGYCMLYATKRFLVEFLRGDNPKLFLGLTMSQEISVVILAASAAFFTYKAAAWRKSVLTSK